VVSLGFLDRRLALALRSFCLVLCPFRWNDLVNNGRWWTS
ncbi:unnamed protein product, partial [Acidithrix sp. C25]